MLKILVTEDNADLIRVESRPGEGSIFTVLLPVKGMEQR